MKAPVTFQSESGIVQAGEQAEDTYPPDRSAASIPSLPLLTSPPFTISIENSIAGIMIR